MYPALKQVSALAPHKLALTFDNGEKRIYDFKSNLEHKYYKALKNAALFKQVSVVDGQLEWITGQDFCPYTLYEQSTPCE